MYVNCTLIFVIKNGLYISKINNDNEMLVHISFFRYTNLEFKNNIDIILALTTDGLKPVNNIYIIKNIIVIILLHFLPDNLFSIKVIPYYNI